MVSPSRGVFEMNTDQLLTVLIYQNALLQTQIFALGQIMINAQICSADHMKATFSEYLTQHGATIVGQIQSDTNDCLAAVTDQGLSVDKMIAKLLKERNRWTPPEGEHGQTSETDDR